MEGAPCRSSLLGLLRSLRGDYHLVHLMNILILSDLHFEFHQDHGQEFLASMTSEPDVIVLAGDICLPQMLPGALSAFCQKAAHVVYTLGNHEFYGSTRPAVLKVMADVCKVNKNLHWLDCGSVEIAGRVFHGTPLWFKEAPLAPKHQMNDWRLIRDYDAWVYEENRRAIRFLTRNVQKGDVVVTHYLPSQRSVLPQFRGSPLNPFFVCDVEGLILAQEPALWIHGHTHGSLDYQIGSTRIVCNPHGYKTENWRDFNPTKILTL